MYNLLLLIYEFGVTIASLFSEKVRKMRHGEKEAFRILKEKVDPSAPYVWFHAASLGEFEQGRPIMEEYRRQHPDEKILLTFFSPSGYEVRKDYPGADIICYLPVDTHSNARRFLDLIHPSKAFFIKYEFWYNYLSILSRRGVPTYSVSSIFREEQIFFQWYGREYRNVLRCFTHFFVQNEKSKALLHTLHIDNVTITGDTRFDRVAQIASQSKTIPTVEQFAEGHRIFIAGSSWQPDEEIFIPYFADKYRTANQQPHDGNTAWKMIIAPHVIAEDHLRQILDLLKGRKVLRFTEVSDPKTLEVKATKEQLQNAEVLIIDCFGLLSSIYKYGDVAYVGGGFGVGIHNLPEAAVWNIPVFFGPNNQKFQEAQDLKQCGGGMEIHSHDDFRHIMDTFLSDTTLLRNAANAAGNYVKSHSGATSQIINTIQ